MTEPKPEWRDGVPWCGGGCEYTEDVAYHGNPDEVFACVEYAFCAPAIRGLVEQAHRVISIFVGPPEHDDCCNCEMCRLAACLPPKVKP